MPFSLKAKFILTLAVCVIAGAGAMALKPKPELPTMSMIPSVFASKSLGDKILQVKIQHDEVQLNSDTSEVFVEISLPYDFSENLNYRWKIGQGVEVLAGELSGQVSGLKANEFKKLRLTVKGFSKQENHHIGFEIYGKKNGRSIYGDALSASDLENTFENTVQNVERIKASQ